MKATVIVPFYNSRATLEKCLGALLNQSVAREALQIICVDDGSTDGGDQLAAATPGVTVVRQENRGPAAARNRGVEHAEGDIILFTDADCVPESEWAAALIACCSQDGVSGAKGVYRTEQKSLTARFVQIEYQQKYSYMKRFAAIDFVDTYSAAFKRTVFDGRRYDEGFPKASVEDQEFSFRLVAAGFQLRFCPQAIVWHRHVESFSGYVRKKLKIGFWKAKILVAMPGRIKGDTHTPLSLKLQLPLVVLLGVAAAARLWAVAAALGLGFLATNLSLFRETWRSDKVLVPLVPLYTLARSLALGAGLLAGLMVFGHRRLLCRHATINH